MCVYIVDNAAGPRQPVDLKTFSRTKPNYYFDNKIIRAGKRLGAKRRRFLFFSSFNVSSEVLYLGGYCLPGFRFVSMGTDRRYFSILSTKLLQVSHIRWLVLNPNLILLNFETPFNHSYHGVELITVRSLSNSYCIISKVCAAPMVTWRTRLPVLTICHFFSGCFFSVNRLV